MSTSSGDIENDIYDEQSLDEDSLDGFGEPQLQRKYEKAQRELITQTVDFSIRTLAGMLEDSQIDTNPKYQRRNRWNTTRQSQLIESFLMNVPMPPVFFSEEEYGYYAVIDGQQRLKAIRDFFSDKLTLTGLQVFAEINGKKRSKLPADLKRILDVRPTMRCIIIQKHSHPNIKYEVFERLNTGGVALNPQEVRNSAFRGPLNDLIISLSESDIFRAALRIVKPDTSALVQHMRDCELILRFFALKDTWDKYDGGMKETLNLYMSDNRDPSADKLSSLKNDFEETLKRAMSLFGSELFHRYDPDSKKFRAQVVASMYDCQMIAAYIVKDAPQRLTQEEAVNRCKELFNDVEFRRSVLEATNTPSRLRYRVSQVINSLSK